MDERILAKNQQELNKYMDESLFTRFYNDLTQVDLLNEKYKDILQLVHCNDIFDVLKLFEYPNSNTTFRIHGFIPDHNDDKYKMVIKSKEMRFMTSKTKLKDEYTNVELFMNQRYLYDNIKIKRNLIPTDYTGEILIPIYNNSNKDLIIINDELNSQAKARETVNEIIIPSYRIQTIVSIMKI